MRWDKLYLIVGDAPREHSGIETAFRFHLDHLIRNQLDVDNFLELAILVINKGKMRPKAIFILLQDIFRGYSNKDCSNWFSFIEKHSKDLHEICNIDSSSKPVAVKGFTGLLKNLSKTSEETTFCGRILVALTRILPLSDPSGVNKKGLINTDNITEFNVDAERNEMVLEDDSPIEFKLHSKFWSLIQIMQNIPTVLENQETWNIFLENSSSVLETFKNVELDIPDDLDESELSDAYFTKFLTFAKLINLEFKDPYFRRHILIQFLICFQYLLSGPTKLSDKKESDIRSLRRNTRSLLSKTFNQGQSISRSISNALNREHNWMEWKKEGCPSFENKELKRKLPPEDLEVEPTPKRPKYDSFGESVLDSLWNESLTIDEFDGMKKGEDFLQNALDEIDEELPKEMRMVREPVYIWKAMRVLSRTSFNTIQDIGSLKKDEELEIWMEKKKGVHNNQAMDEE
eukprot:TRINITY_DN3230_c2_g1_i1.p1 TRINITY_DN3230_c2_g1~~TRINITY_DN3230_c2_g1_i1.p1  ORF type:complete len:459 (-),score=116.65 TRINITY_DN3230_c2_g1_i1:4-1380(-)